LVSWKMTQVLIYLQILDFWKEAQILTSFHHPEVVSFYGVFHVGSVQMSTLIIIIKWNCTNFAFNNSHYFFICANLVQFIKEYMINKSMTKFSAF
jgi:hypothetical protein